MEAPARADQTLAAYLGECRQWVLGELQRIIPSEPGGGRRALYRLMLEYPLRDAKALRPALCIAVCRALGGERTAVLRSAAVLELYHNAFLIHDDIEDASLMRRGAPTLHHSHGVPVAINVGDAMFALALRPLLDNTELLGLGKALQILRAVARMVQESVEGQAVELDWIRDQVWDITDEDYVSMVIQKTGWYSFITPVIIGQIAAGAAPELAEPLEEFARCLGVAFQIQDDLLNLDDHDAYGKESLGDLWEGKRTLILLHALREATPGDRAAGREILAKARPGGAAPRDGPVKTEAEVRWLFDLIERHRGREYAGAHARRWAQSAGRALARLELADCTHREFLSCLPRYVLERLR